MNGVRNSAEQSNCLLCGLDSNSGAIFCEHAKSRAGAQPEECGGATRGAGESELLHFRLDSNSGVFVFRIDFSPVKK